MSALVPENTPEARKTLSPIHLATAAYPPVRQSAPKRFTPRPRPLSKPVPDRPSPSSRPQTFFAVPQFDSTVTPTQSWRFAEKLKALGVEVGTGRADGAGHCFDRRVRFVVLLPVLLDCPLNPAAAFHCARTPNQGGALNAAGGQWWDDVTRPALDFLVSHLVV